MNQHNSLAGYLTAYLLLCVAAAAVTAAITGSAFAAVFLLAPLVLLRKPASRKTASGTSAVLPEAVRNRRPH